MRFLGAGTRDIRFCQSQKYKILFYASTWISCCWHMLHMLHDWWVVTYYNIHNIILCIEKYVYIFPGFSVLFSLMDPVPYQVKVVFHIFGVADFAYSLAQAVISFHAESCVSNKVFSWWQTNCPDFSNSVLISSEKVKSEKVLVHCVIVWSGGNYVCLNFLF